MFRKKYLFIYLLGVQQSKMGMFNFNRPLCLKCHGYIQCMVITFNYSVNIKDYCLQYDRAK